MLFLVRFLILSNRVEQVTGAIFDCDVERSDGDEDVDNFGCDGGLGILVWQCAGAVMCWCGSGLVRQWVGKIIYYLYKLEVNHDRLHCQIPL